MSTIARARARSTIALRGGALFFASLIVTPDALAQATTPPAHCVGGPAAVTGLTGPPNWIGTLASYPDATTGARLDLDEPRWAGAPLMPFATSFASGAPTYRILREGDFLYVSFHAPTASTGLDVVYFGFSENTATQAKAYLLPIVPAPAGTAGDPIQHTIGHHYSQTSATGAWTFQASQPGWVDQIATWRNAAQTGVAFGVNFRIRLKPPPVFPPPNPPPPPAPAGSQVNIARNSPFYAIFGVVQQVGTGVASYLMPPVSALSSMVATGIPVPSDRTRWAAFNGLATTCLEGITLDSYNIRTSASDSTSLLIGPPNPMQNTFTIEPQNIRNTVPVIDNIVRSKIELSDWGSSPDASQLVWHEVPGTTTNPPSGGTWTWTWNPAPAPTTVGAAIIGFTCHPGTAAYCPSLAPSTASTASTNSTASSGSVSQGILVTLGPDPLYANSELVRIRRGAVNLNMAFASLSESSREATISLKGTGKGKGSREVYLKVVRRNMPPHGDEVQKLPLDEMQRVVRFIRNPPRSPFEYPPVYPQPSDPAGAQKKVAQRAEAERPKPAQAKPGPEQPKAAAGEPGVGDSTSLPSPLPLHYSSATQHELLSRVWPVYEVHAYYETGETITESGKTLKVLKELTPFGYLLHHAGPFYGFSDSIEGVGSQLTKVEEDLYRATVPDDGSIRIRTKIRTEDRPRTKPGCCNQAPPQVNIKLRGCYCRAPGAGGGDSRLLPLALLPFAAFLIRRRRKAAAHR